MNHTEHPNPSPHEVAEFIENTCKQRRVRPVTVVIQNMLYAAAQYTDSNKDMAIYVVGKLPQCKMISDQTCFTVKGDPRDWFIACYYPLVVGCKQSHRDAQDPRFASYHPFGCNFVLTVWSVDKSNKIDHHEPREYIRIPIEVNLQ